MSKTRSICTGAVVAALYVALTLVNPISWASMQFRISNTLCAAPFVNRRLAPGILVGIAIANFFSPLGMVDVLFGVCAEGAAYALVVYGPLKRVSIWAKGVVLAAIVALVVGAELTLVYSIPYLVNLVSLFLSTLVIVEAGAAVFSRGPLCKVVKKL